MWRGLSVFDSYRAVHALGVRFRWRHGAFVAVLELPDDAPFTLAGPDHKGHWLIYDNDGSTISEHRADAIRRYVVQVVHGPSTPNLPF
jgi:hypothetical protein